MKFSRSIVLTLLKGICIAVIPSIIVLVLSTVIMVFYYRSLTPLELKNAYPIVLTTVLRILNLLILAIHVYAGFFVSKKIGQRGLFYAIFLAILISLVGTLPNIILSLASPIGDEQIYSRVIAGLPPSLLRSVLTVGFGGWLGEWVSKRKTKNGN